jgi:hypothetical protein
MKKIFLGVLAMMMLVMSGCGGGGSAEVVVTVPIMYPPSITTYQFTQYRSTELISGSVNFDAPDSDIKSMTVVVYDSRGSEVLGSRLTTPLSLPGVTQGTVAFSIDYITYPADQFSFYIYLTDWNGYSSNTVAGTFLVP